MRPRRFIVADVGGGPLVIDTHARPVAAPFCAPCVQQGPLPGMSAPGLPGDEWMRGAATNDALSRATYLCELLNRDHEMRAQIGAAGAPR